jgi:hypothetical protein
MQQALRTRSRERGPGPGRFRGVSSLLSACIFASFLGACASVGLPTVQEKTAVGAGTKTIVLVRVECTIEDQQPYEVFAHSLMDDNISFGLGSFDTGGEPTRLTSLRFLSPESRKDGWTYFVLPQGVHYLAVYPPRRTDVLTYEQSIKNTPRWRMDIPPDVRLVYAGTLRLTGESTQLLFGERIMTSIQFDAANVTNDEELARKLLTEQFPELGEVRTVLLRRHQGPAILHAPLPSPAH